MLGNDISSSAQPANPHGHDVNADLNIVLDSKAAAEDFFYNSQQKLAHSLAELKRTFVSAIRTLANKAKRERFESLSKTVQSLKDLEPELKDEILDELDSKAVNVQTLAFRKASKNIKTERVR
jgi:hypothetical protein